MTSCTFNGVEYSQGAVICSNGKELKCYGGVWSETGNTCTTTSDSEVAEFSGTGGEVTATVAAGSMAVAVPLSGTGSTPKPDVFTQDVGSTICQIAGRRHDIIGMVRISGEGTSTVIAEVWPNSLHSYSGTAYCTVIL